MKRKPKKLRNRRVQRQGNSIGRPQHHPNCLAAVKAALRSFGETLRPRRIDVIPPMLPTIRREMMPYFMSMWGAGSCRGPAWI